VILLASKTLSVNGIPQTKREWGIPNAVTADEDAVTAENKETGT
jgi:hypothetical protein